MLEGMSEISVLTLAAFTVQKNNSMITVFSLRGYFHRCDYSLFSNIWNTKRICDIDFVHGTRFNLQQAALRHAMNVFSAWEAVCLSWKAARSFTLIYFFFLAPQSAAISFVLFTNSAPRMDALFRLFLSSAQLDLISENWGPQLVGCDWLINAPHFAADFVSADSCFILRMYLNVDNFLVWSSLNGFIYKVLHFYDFYHSQQCNVTSMVHEKNLSVFPSYKAKLPLILTNQK